MEIKIADESDREKWNEIVYSSPQGTIFHTWEWLKIMEKHSSNELFKRQYKTVLYPVMVMKGSENAGLLPLYCSKSPLMKIVSSPPQNVEDLYLGPVLNNYDSFNTRKKQAELIQFHEKIDEFIKNELKPNFVLIRTSPGLQDSRPYKWSGYSVEPRHTYFLDLRIGEDKIWKGFRKSLRMDIEKAKKEGIEVDEGTRKDVDYIYDLLKGRDRINATKEFLLEIFDNFHPNNIKVFISKKDNDCLSGIITTCYKNKVSFWIGSPRFLYHGISPNELVLWESIKWAIDNGFEFYEIVGADDLSLYPFKSKFNGELINSLSMKWFSPMFGLIAGIYQSIKPRSG